MPLDAKNSKKLEKLEYYVGRDNPGCHLLVNKQPHEMMACQAEPEEPPEFQRGPVTSSFEHGPLFSTNFAVFDKKT